jgi:DNA polymerase-3 subunit gamma/tau
MTETTLDKKHRPQTFDDVIGNDATIKAIQTALLREQSFPTVSVLYGPSGSGKTTLLRIIANELGAKGKDLHELDIGNIGGVKEGRAIGDMIKISPWGKCRVIGLDECQQGTAAFWNSLLKALEEPPKNNHFILCTTDFNKLPKAIKTRCTKFVTSLLKEDELFTLLDIVLEKENVKLSDTLLDEIIKASYGSARQAMVILDGIIDLTDEQDQLEIIRSYYSDEDSVIDLYKALLYKKSWNEITSILKGMDAKDAESYRYALLTCFERDLFKGGKESDRVADMMEFFRESFQFTNRPGLTQACWYSIQ